MNNKTCGECQWYDDQHLLCVVGGDVEPTDCACDSFIPIKFTNGDKIRQMSNDELAGKFGYPCPPLPKKHCNGIDNIECTECWLNWLNAPAESEGTNE